MVGALAESNLPIERTLAQSLAEARAPTLGIEPRPQQTELMLYQPEQCSSQERSCFNQASTRGKTFSMYQLLPFLA